MGKRNQERPNSFMSRFITKLELRPDPGRRGEFREQERKICLEQNY